MSSKVAMLLLDVNVLVYAHREDTEQHAACRAWLEQLIGSGDGFGLCDLALAGFIRVVTHSRVLNPPTPLPMAARFAEQIRSAPNCVVVSPGDRHWGIFLELCREHHAKGNDVPDAYFAALAIEHGCTWATADQGFKRFAGLKTFYPTDQKQ